MRPQIVTALCLLTVGACAHQQQPRESSANSAEMQNTESARSEASPPGMDANEPAVQQAQPSMGMSPPESAGSSASLQQQSAAPQPATAMPAAGGAAASPTAQASPTDSRGDGNKQLDAPSPPDQQQMARAPSQDEIELRERIQSALGSAPNLSYSARHVGVTVEKSDVTLHGDVRNDRERKEVEALVRQIQGVQKVKNQLSSVSQSTMRPPVR